MRLDNFAKNNIIMFFAATLGSFFNFLYQWVMLRSLSREVFASLNSLLSVLVIISVPAMAFTILVTKHVCVSHTKNELEELRAIWQKLAKQAFYFSISIFIMIIFFARDIAYFLNVGSQTSIIILGAIFFLSGIATVLNGGLQGLEKFKWLALVSLTAGFLKLFLSFILIRLMPHLDGALFGFLMAIFVGIFIGLRPVLFLFKKTGIKKINLGKLYFYILPTLTVTLCFALLTNLDMVLVKHFFLIDAQDYSVAQMIGKIVLFIPGVVYVVMFSRASSLHAANMGSKEILRRSVLFTLTLSLCAVVLFNIFPGAAFRILSRSYNFQVVALSRVFSFTMLFLALSNILFYYQLSVERYSFIKPLAVVTLAIFVFLWFFHRTTLWVISTMLLGSLVIFLLNLSSAFKVASAYEKH